MSDVSKTNELIAKLALAAEDAAGGPPSAEQVDALIDLVDALEASQPSEDGKYIFRLIETIKQTGGSVEIHGVKIMPCDEFGRTAAVPDAATEELLKRVEEAEAQSAEDRVEWQQMKERASQRFNAYQQKKRELRQMEIRAEKAEAERAAALAAIEVTRKLHHKITRYGNDYYSISSESYEDDPSSYDDLEPFDLCAECYEVERLICEECGGDAPIGHRSSWPCPTVAALDGAPEPEGRWEYRGRLQSCGYVAEGYISAEHAMNGLRVELEDHPYLVMDDTAIVERARVREWLPVEGEKP